MAKRNKYICFGIIIIMIIMFINPQSAQAIITNDLIEQMQGEIQQTQQYMQDIENGITNVEKILGNLKNDRNNLQAYIQEIDEAMNTIQAKIDDLAARIEEQQQLVEQARLDLAEAIRVEQEQYNNMLMRIRFMYENGTNMYIELIFSAEDFADFLTKAEYISSVTDYDRKMLEEYIQNKEMVEMTKLELEAQEELLEQEKAAQDKELENYALLQDAKEQELAQTQSSIYTAQDQIDDYQAELDAMEDTIATLEAEIAAEKKRVLAANGTLLSYDGGKFVWPIAKYTRISSEFGYRQHPTLLVTLFHNGIDIASPYGTNIYAAYDGKVVAAAYTSVMGNYIMIDHGDNIYTVYMHCSKLYVSSGDIVIAGETIAAVGSTGRSTGNHLHFSVRVNGEYVSPWNYVKQP